MPRPSSTFRARILYLIRQIVTFPFVVSPVVGLIFYVGLIAFVASATTELIRQQRHDARIQAWQADTHERLIKQRDEIWERQHCDGSVPPCEVVESSFHLNRQ